MRVICGSRLPGSAGMATVAEPDGPACLADEPIAVALSDSRRAAATITKTRRLRMSTFLSGPEWDGSTDVEPWRKSCPVSRPSHRRCGQDLVARFVRNYEAFGAARAPKCM